MNSARREFLLYSVLVLFIIGLVTYGLVSLTGSEPNSWDPAQACVSHRGARQIIGTDYPTGVLCVDQTFISNPYD